MLAGGWHRAVRIRWRTVMLSRLIRRAAVASGVQEGEYMGLIAHRRAVLRGLAAGLAAASFGALPAFAQPRPVPDAVTTIDVPNVGPMQVLTYKAQFVSADPATRRVVLQGSWGKRWSVLVPAMMGDVMSLANSRSLVIRVLPGTATYLGKATQGRPGEVFAEVALNAGLPGWPQDFGMREVTITTIMVNLDKANGTITFEGADGFLRTVKADPKVLADSQGVDIGDLCQIRYYEGITINAVN